MIAKTAADGNVSEYDSWTDLEENFAKAYEPIPLSIEMTDWLKMSKYDILKNVKSQKIRKDFEYMSKSEILVQIDRMKKSAKYLSAKFGVHNLVGPMHNHPPLDSLHNIASGNFQNLHHHQQVRNILHYVFYPFLFRPQIRTQCHIVKGKVNFSGVFLLHTLVVLRLKQRPNNCVGETVN